MTDQGNIIPADRLLMLLVESLADQYPGATIVYDVKCSRELGTLIEKLVCNRPCTRAGIAHATKPNRQQRRLAVSFLHIFFSKTAGLDLTMACMPVPEYWSASPKVTGSCDEKFRTFPIHSLVEEIRLKFASRIN